MWDLKPIKVFFTGGMKMVSKLFQTAALGFMIVVCAGFVDKQVILKGKLISFDDKLAIIQTETGRVNVPAASVKEMKYVPGQNVVVFVGFKELIEDNMDRLKQAGLTSDDKTGDSKKKE